MKILHVNKFFWQSGGVERYMFEVAERLKREGHESIFFSMQHPNNFASEQSRYFVSHVEYRNTSPAYKARTLLRTVGKTIYSPESRRKMEALLRAERPDLAHIHLISHQISPSVLLALKKLNVPVVQTVHEYKRLCPSAQFYIHHKDEICERCLHGNYFHATYHRCIKNSLPASALATVAQYVHKYSGIYEKNIDFFVAPSRFMAEKLTEGGLPPEKLRVLGYTLDLEKYEPRFEPGDYAVFYGRISSEKGIRYLLDVARLQPDMRILVIGDGPQLPELKAEAKADSLQIEFPGHKDGDELRDLVRRAAFVVVPSQWYDNSPMDALLHSLRAFCFFSFHRSSSKSIVLSFRKFSKQN